VNASSCVDSASLAARLRQDLEDYRAGRLASILAPPAPTAPAIAGDTPRRPAAALRGVRDQYDVIVIGSGLAGLTSASRLARCGWSVLLLEQHYNFGGLATWFKRKRGHVFDISLHGFPIGMIKTCRKYWTREIADAIVQLRRVRFDNPEFQLETTYDRDDFTRILIERFGVPAATVEDFFTTLRGMNFYDDQSLTTRQLFQRYFPGRSDVMRLLMEPIAYANGSTLDDPAITYGIVFSNFMSKGVYTFRGGTAQLIAAMKAELSRLGVDLRNHASVERILVEGPPGQGRATGVVVNGRRIQARAVVSNASLGSTVHRLAGDEAWTPEFLEEARKVRINSSSCQVYLGIRRGESIPDVGELLFSSTAPEFDSAALCALECTSRTYSFYYPELRPGTDLYSVVCSTNANYQDWIALPPEEYAFQKEKLARESIAHLERYIPGVGPKIDHVEASTPRTFQYFTQHVGGASFGTKFEGLKVSQSIPKEIGGLFHAGSVGIIMSGWLGAANYGVIVSNEVDKYLAALGRREARAGEARERECSISAASSSS
jgi:phytoene dehydrogenase-like protein